MAKSKDKEISNLNIPKWILWAAIASLIYAVVFFIAFDIGKKTTQLKSLVIKTKEIKKVIQKPLEVPLLVPSEDVHHHPRFYFTFDNKEILQPLRKREKIDQVIAGAKTNMEVFSRLMSWTRAQWPPGRPDPYPPINAIVILDKIRRGETGGFCAQYCFVLVQCLQSLGYKARYVTIKGHEVTEVWSPELLKWVMLDPLYELYISRGTTPLSVFEIHTMILRKEYDLKVHAQTTLGDLHEYLSRYEKFAVWAKNDHVSSPANFVDIERYKIYFLDDPNERMDLPVSSLYTLFSEDLYFNPFMGQMRKSQ
jgi:hypothetical protein